MTTERPLESSIVADCHQKWQLILERYAWAVLRDWALAADAVQNAFVALARFGGDVEPDARKAWMFRVVHRESIRMRNAEMRRQNVTSQLVQESPTSYHANPLGEIAKTEEIEELRRKIATLPSEQQKIIRMRIVEEKTFSEIANLLAIPIGTALSRMRLALERLKANRHDEGNSHDQ
jgi:RNA polymerase sigma-70 factor (ECF subfamily)